MKFDEKKIIIMKKKKKIKLTEIKIKVIIAGEMIFQTFHVMR